MPERNVEFWWDVASEGYRWVKATARGASGEELFLTTGAPLGPIGYMRRRCQPLAERPGLFRIFADLDPAPDAILSFADAYGHLTRDRSTAREDSDNASAQEEIELLQGEEPLAAEGEPLSFWLGEMDAMRHAVAIWDAVRERNAEALAQCIRWREDGVYYECASAKAEPISTYADHPEFLRWFRKGDLVEPAILWLLGRLNARLERRTPALFQWSPERPGELHLVYIPGSLIEAMWLEFAFAVDESKDYRKCLQCGTWFEIAPDKARANRLFCSSACKSRNYRERKARAQELFARGMDLKAIADELGTDKDTVEGWVK